ncbi:MAG: hypothetical protein QOD76_1710 [Solirubrobacteraceae bacterium]|nr:hypothetical protein [Solirubrobacteraceae bacterium]
MTPEHQEASFMQRTSTRAVHRRSATGLARRLLSALGFAAALDVVLASPALAKGVTSTPAAGAEIGQVIIATAGATVLTAAMLGLVIGHRSGRVAVIGRLAGFSERVTGTAGWAALPGALLGGTLLIAVFGMYWDISLHLDNGRDPGPLANPAHYFILLGLFGVLFAGVAAIALPLRRPNAAAVRLPNGWYAPVGGVLIAVCGSISLLAFPLDDIWHRLFGQDVTLWGPTHLLLIGGASFSIVGAWILHVEGERTGSGKQPWLGRLREVILAGAFLVGLSTFQAEFDFAVPQFRLVCHPVLLMLAAGIGLVAARVRLGRGGALGAVAVFLAIRGLLALLVGPVFGQTTPHFPLYIVEALLVELVAWRFSRNRPIALGACAGVAIGTIGLAAEWGWSHLWWTIPWPGSLFPEAAIAGFVAAVAGGVLGGFIGRSLLSEPVKERTPRWVVPAAALAAVGVIAYTLPMPTPAHPPKATVVLHDVQGGAKRVVAAAITLDPPSAAKDANWINITGWQGHGSVVDPLKRVGPGRYVTTKTIPVNGNWKVTLRLQRGSEVLGLPIFLPRDPAIPAKETPASARFTREFVRDKKNLQREQKAGVPGYLTAVAYGAVLLIWLTMLAALGWGLVRLARIKHGPGGPPVDEARPTPSAVPHPAAT